jgi:Sec-independent protein translocase protein TatA
MEILNIGPLEFILILILALIVLGPDDMVKYSRVIARFIRNVVRSPLWKEMVSTSEEIKTIPQQLVKEADLEESLKDLKQISHSLAEPLKVDLETEIKNGSEAEQNNPSVIAASAEPDKK